MTAHAEICEAPICSCSNELGWERSVIWYPGEDICRKGRTAWQVNQRKINKLFNKGKLKILDIPFTAEHLGQIQRITSTLGGRSRSKVANKRRGSPYYPESTSLRTSKA